MCGRYALYGPRSRLYDQFDIVDDDVDEKPRDMPVDPFSSYNIAPSQSPPVIRTRPGAARELIRARWGLLPSWVQDPGKLAQPINAKIETAAEKPMFRHAFRKSRVIVPASGFYEWRPGPDFKQPFFVRPAGEQLFGFAALLEHWAGTDGPLLTFAILTTAANELMRPIHDRMPVILQPDDYAAWLDPGITDAQIVHELAGQFPPEQMALHPVNRAVGNPRSQGPGLIEPVEI
ncbi:SOS response-associated peptidase [Azoarcus sp. L1K30]|uniref:SOS response-associated peptidase n=1 Tax=Azoarcus sp. L1K30 TaxID=2820277 RepID=UPI001B819C6F|nr:SOS response-associated peptidase [Azoarcus sp. L1K30]MBR0565518.1 SOS response-associated peptidase [Azoarcus sp. L1K30]